jgi:2-polyprenyl-3-methyl-5-hydroxy-6-metoxy-1,4-benzoquinol methylase
MQKMAGRAARSRLFAGARRLFEQNTKNWNLPLSKFQKVWVGGYVILADYAVGRFPPRFEDQAKAYAMEIHYRTQIPGVTAEDTVQTEMRKPFWFGPGVQDFLGGFTRLMAVLEQLNLPPPARILELGCGTGWMAEFLAISGFEVVGTSIAPTDIADAEKRRRSLEAKGLPARLRFEVAAMESVHTTVGPVNHYDVVFCFEALHHAFDWREAVRSAHACLRPGGWLLICSEPNVLHTFVSYRSARLVGTHEIGFCRSELEQQLKNIGFTEVKYLGSPVHFWAKKHWLAARKPA